MALPALIALPLCYLFLWALGRWALEPANASPVIQSEPTAEPNPVVLR